MTRPLSVVEGRDPEVLQVLLDFHAKPNPLILDSTANARTMWKGVTTTGRVVMADIDLAQCPVVVSDFGLMAFRSESFDVVVFDPPHLPLAAASVKSLAQYVGDYGLKRSIRGDGIASVFPGFLHEAARVLKSDGLIFAKIKDFVHNHRYQWTLVSFINAVNATGGLTPCDLIVKRDPAGGNLKSGRWKRAYHVRNAHCWWVVVRKGGCEPRKSHQ